MVQENGLTYYEFHLKPYNLVRLTAVGPPARVFIMSISANSRQWRRHEKELRAIQQSFNVPPAVVAPSAASST